MKQYEDDDIVVCSNCGKKLLIRPDRNRKGMPDFETVNCPNCGEKVWEGRTPGIPTAEVVD